MATTALANPQNGTVVQGTATITSPSAAVLDVVQKSPNAIINWGSFSIGGNETVNFLQPSSNSATLNRVVGATPSLIEGILDANGRVFLLNANGILFGKSARLDVGGLIATTSNIANQDFMAGRYSFTPSGTGSSVVNDGSISVKDGGFAALVAPSVANQGTITAKLGRIALGGGESFTIDLYGDRLINFAVPALNEAPQTTEVNQSGNLIAEGGRVLLTTQAANAVVSGVINMSGLIQARSATRGAAGQIILDGGAGQVVVSGTMDASSSRGDGGTVDVYANNVMVQPSARIDVSGEAGGGSVQIGGGLVGEATPRASVTRIASGATVNADAVATGSGGTVSVWGTQENDFAGSISAAGGKQAGNGGFIEVSTEGTMQFLGAAVAAASRGAPGTILLDPASITIEPGGTSTDGSVLSGSALSALLRTPQNVVLTATQTITDNDLIDGRPTVGSANLTAVSGSLTMSAGAIIINQPVITNNAAINLTSTSGSVTIQGDGYLYVANGPGQVGSAPINVTSAGGISALTSSNGGGQLVSLGTITLQASGAVELQANLAGLGASTPSGIGALVVSSSADQISFAGVDSNGLVSLTAANGVSTNGGFIHAAGPVTVGGGSGAVALSGIQSGGTVTVSGSQISNSQYSISASGAVTLTATGGDASHPAIQLADLGTSSNNAIPGIIVNGNGDVTLSSTGGGAVELQSGITTGGNIFVGSTASPVGGSLTTGADGALQAGSAVSLNSAGPMTIGGGITAQSAVTLTSQAGVTVSGYSIATQGGELQVTAGSAANQGITINALTGATTTPAAALVNNGAPGANGAGAVTLATQGPVALNSSITTAGGDIDIGSAGAPASAIALSPGVVFATSNSSSAPTSGGINIYTAGAISGSGASLNAGADVVLNSSGGGAITLGSNTSATDAIATAGDVTVLTTGAVTLNSGITSTGGSVTIGNSTTPIASLSTPDGTVNGATVLSTLYANNNVSIYSSGPVSLAAATAANGYVSVTGGSITLGDQQWLTDGPDTPTGGIFAAGSNGTNGVELIVPNSGSINILGPIVSLGGNVLIGLSSPSTTYGPTSTNAQVNLSNDITTGGYGVTINGDVTLFSGLSFFDLATLMYGPNYLTAPTPKGKIGSDPQALPYYINGNNVTSFNDDPNVIACYAAGAALCTVVNGTPTPVAGSGFVLPWVPCTDTTTCPGNYQLTGDPTSANYAANFYSAYPQFVQTYANLGWGGSSTSTSCGYVSCGIYAVDSTGTVNTSTPWAVTSLYPTTLEPQATVLQRLNALNALLSYAVASIDTTNGGKDAGGASVTISGNVSRYTSPPNIGSSATFCATALCLYPSHVSDELSVNLGNVAANSMTVKGSLGDSASIESGTGNSDGDGYSADVPIGDIFNDTSTNYTLSGQIPVYGSFQVRIAGTNASPLAVGTSGGVVNSIVINGTDVNPSLIANPQCSINNGGGCGNQAYYYPSLNLIAAGPSTAPPDNVLVVPRFYQIDDEWTVVSPTGTGTGTPSTQAYQGSAGTGSASGTGLLASNGAASLGGFGAGLPPPDLSVAPPPVSAAAGEIPAEAEDPSRSNPLDAAHPNSESATASDTADQAICPRGAARTADLGQQRELSGAAAAVFYRCKGDFH